MKVKILNTGGITEVNDSYGLRLIEHGKAVLVKAAEEPAAKKKAEPAAVKPARAKKSKKG